MTTEISALLAAGKTAEVHKSAKQRKGITKEPPVRSKMRTLMEQKAALRVANQAFDDACPLFVGREWTCTCLDFQHRGPKVCKHIRKRAKQLVSDKLSPVVGTWIEPSETDDGQYVVSVKLMDATPSA